MCRLVLWNSLPTMMYLLIMCACFDMIYNNYSSIIYSDLCSLIGIMGIAILYSCVNDTTCTISCKCLSSQEFKNFREGHSTLLLHVNTTINTVASECFVYCMTTLTECLTALLRVWILILYYIPSSLALEWVLSILCDATSHIYTYCVTWNNLCHKWLANAAVKQIKLN